MGNLQLQYPDRQKRDLCRYGASIAYSAILSQTFLSTLPAAAQEAKPQKKQPTTQPKPRNSFDSIITITNAYGSIEEDRMGAFFRFRSKIELADVVIEALQNSIPLMFIFEYRVVDTNTWFGHKTLAKQMQQIELRYYALLDHYTLKHTLEHKPEESVIDSYPTLASALTFLIAVETFPLRFSEPLPEMDTKESIRLQARLKLDVDALPAPLRPYAFANNSWDVDSDWFDWPVAL